MPLAAALSSCLPGATAPGQTGQHASPGTTCSAPHALEAGGAHAALHALRVMLPLLGRPPLQRLVYASTLAGLQCGARAQVSGLRTLVPALYIQ